MDKHSQQAQKTFKTLTPVKCNYSEGWDLQTACFPRQPNRCVSQGRWPRLCFADSEMRHRRFHSAPHLNFPAVPAFPLSPSPVEAEAARVCSTPGWATMSCLVRFRKQISHSGPTFILFFGSASHCEAQDFVCDGVGRWMDVNRCWMMEAWGQGGPVSDDTGE